MQPKSANRSVRVTLLLFMALLAFGVGCKTVVYKGEYTVKVTVDPKAGVGNNAIPVLVYLCDKKAKAPASKDNAEEILAHLTAPGPYLKSLKQKGRGDSFTFAPGSEQSKDVTLNPVGLSSEDAPTIVVMASIFGQGHMFEENLIDKQRAYEYALTGDGIDKIK